MRVSDEKQSDASAHNPLFKAAFTYLPVAAAIISHQQKVVESNYSFQEIFQLPDDALSGSSIHIEQLPSSFWQKSDVLDHIQTAIEEAADYSEKVFDWQHEDGSLRYIQVQATVLPSYAKEELLLLTFSDATAAKQAEKSHNESIRHMMHELRNPLSNISLCVELLADSTQENNQEDTVLFLSKASNSVQRMKQLINDLSDAARKATSDGRG